MRCSVQSEINKLMYSLPWGKKVLLNKRGGCNPQTPPPPVSAPAWVQCFEVNASVHSRKYPEVVSELLTYMVSVMKADSEWAQYDSTKRWAEVLRLYADAKYM